MGLFGKLKSVLSKTRDGIAKKLNDLFARNKLGDEFYEDLEDILISSDVSVKTSMEIIDEIKETAIKEKCRDKDYVIKLLKKELFDTLNYADAIQFKSPAVIMIVGVNGVGKTTTIGKLANKFVGEGKSVTIAAADTFRAAAADQLSVWADRAKVRIIKHAEGADAAAVVFDAVSSAKARNTDALIIDTAGRLHVKANLMEELKKMDRVVRREFPEANFYKLIVLDATTGQNGLIQAKQFLETAGLAGIVLTKLDGTAKGGVVLNIKNELGVPVKFVGVGEKIDDLRPFNPQAFAEGLFDADTDDETEE